MKPIRHPLHSRMAILVFCAVLLATHLSDTANAQITAPRVLSGTVTRRATIDEYLINRLRATTEDQKDYVREVVRLCHDGRLELRLILALQRRARVSMPHFPLPVFERTLRAEAGKRRVVVPTLDEIVARNGAAAARAAADSRFRFK